MVHKTGKAGTVLLWIIGLPVVVKACPADLIPIFPGSVVEWSLSVHGCFSFQ